MGLRVERGEWLGAAEPGSPRVGTGNGGGGGGAVGVGACAGGAEMLPARPLSCSTLWKSADEADGGTGI